jgi:hypothetical protein
MNKIFNLRKGALPVPYIVALIIAIIVIAVLVYWFFILSGQGGSEATFRLCQGKLFTYCSQWAVCNYLECQPTKNGQAADFYEINPECTPFKGVANKLPSAVTNTACKSVLGQG